MAKANCGNLTSVISGKQRKLADDEFGGGGAGEDALMKQRVVL